MRGSLFVTSLALTACASAPAPASPASPAPPTPTPAATATAEAPAPAAPSASAALPPTGPILPGIVSMGDIIGPPSFDPKPALVKLKPEILRCYTETRQVFPDLHGKLMLRIKINEAGAVTGTDAVPGGTANDPGLLGCIGDVIKGATFPKPGGLATITVPLVLRR